ncbi:sensor histidine kinase [Conexibacter sp. CPCC 206217]|uniref:sensor histidine kinase n=1 Tax=Conexibacter sp. CPCC 206217 TaxID=3064574 RepID=UPI002717245F|nr:ATP-binding protein [Conexibacter sp. CPCC 206217]MDO8212480.1 histidine kinase [Conexibacter sp. CPCC 206217]
MAKTARRERGAAKTARRERERRSAALAEQRRAIARDVHDGLAQELAFIAAQLQRLDGAAPDPDLVRELRAASRRALIEARLTIDTLRAPSDVPLGTLVEQAVASFTARFGVAVELRLELAGAAASDRARRTAVLRILGQALANAVEHGTAERVRVCLRTCAGGLSLSVADDGRGFAPPVGAPAPRGWGLVSMRERAELLGGSFRVSARPGEGTEVAVVLP